MLNFNVVPSVVKADFLYQSFPALLRSVPRQVGEIDEGVVVPVVGRGGAQPCGVHLAPLRRRGLRQEDDAESLFGMFRLAHSIESLCQFHVAKVRKRAKTPKDTFLCLLSYNI